MKKQLIFCLFLVALAFSEEDCVQYGNICESQEWFQNCIENLGNLQRNSINSQVKVNYDKIGNIFYEFNIYYQNGYQFDSECLTQQIFFQNSQVNKDNQSQNYYKFQISDNQNHVQFFISHQDVNENCVFVENNWSLIWQCHLNMDVKFAGITQLSYYFSLTTQLDKLISASTVLPALNDNIVPEDEDCCQNPLDIKSRMLFCKDPECQEYYEEDQPLEVSQKQQIYIEHTIESEEYQDYGFEGVQVQIGDFIPHIIKKNSSQVGKTIYTVSSNVQLGDQTIAVISQVYNKRRMLGQDVGQEYKIKNKQQVNIKDIENYGDNKYNDINEKNNNNEKQQQSKGKENSKILIAIMITLVIAIVYLIFMMVYFFCLKPKLKLQQQQQQQQKQKDIEDLEGKQGIDVQFAGNTPQKNSLVLQDQLSDQQQDIVVDTTFEDSPNKIRKQTFSEEDTVQESRFKKEKLQILQQKKEQLQQQLQQRRFSERGNQQEKFVRNENKRYSLAAQRRRFSKKKKGGTVVHEELQESIEIHPEQKEQFASQIQK